MTIGDYKQIHMLNNILERGCIDNDPRPHYSDGVPAHTLSVNHVMMTYDQRNNELPIITLRPIAIKKAIGEILWIYRDESNDLSVLKNKYGVSWWDSWDIGDGTIGSCYGETVRKHNLMKNLLDDLHNNPDGRRHIINLWQEDDFKLPHGLKPCCYQTVWNVRHEKNLNYLDMCVFQRSSDYIVSGVINQMQYLALLYMVSRHCGFEPGKFSWMCANVQIYDRHIEQAKTLLKRKPIDCNPRIWLNPEIHNFYDFCPDDIKIIDFPKELIKMQNPQLKFDVAI